jgi:thiol-disulfide isomerase/thioredoxin
MAFAVGRSRSRFGVVSAAFIGLAALALSGCGRAPARVQDAGAALTVVGAEDVERLVGEARGRVVLVNAWATWCDPCREEFPALVRLHREIPPGDFLLVLVSADFASQRPQVERFLAGQGVDFPTYFKGQGDDDFIARMSPAWSGALPATWLHRRDGSVAEFWEGGASYETFSGKVRTLLDETAGAGGD